MEPCASLKRASMPPDGKLAKRGSNSRLSREPVRDLDQIAVRIAEIDGKDRPRRARARDRALDHRHALGCKMSDELGQRDRRDEAQVSRARRRVLRLRFEFAAALVQIDLLAAER